MRNQGALVTLLAVSLIMGCSSDRQDLGGAMRRDANLDAPKTLLALSSPGYGKTGLAKGVPIGLSVLVADPAQPILDVLGAAVFEAYPSREAVSGSWVKKDTSNYEFAPASPLVEGDYLLRFPKADGKALAVKPRPYNLFRVGSALRVRAVELLEGKKGVDNLTRVEVLLSEQPQDIASITVKAEGGDGKGAFTVLEVKETTRSGAVVSLVLSKDLAWDMPLRVTVSGAELDGAWTGKAGSGEIGMTFVPNEVKHEEGQAIYYLPPPVDIEPKS